MRQTLLILAIATLALTATARKQSTTRDVRRMQPTPGLLPSATSDTIAVTPSDVRLSGYDKPLRATRETVFVTSTLPDTIRGMRLRLSYSDMSDRPLHTRDVDITADIAPDDTRMVDFKSWDTQKSFYYHLGAKPSRGYATPYKVEATVIHVITDHRQHD